MTKPAPLTNAEVSRQVLRARRPIAHPHDPTRMLTKTARWLTLTIAFHPIQSAAGYARSSLTGGTYLRNARSECRQQRSVAALQLGNNLWIC